MKFREKIGVGVAMSLGVCEYLPETCCAGPICLYPALSVLPPPALSRQSSSTPCETRTFPVSHLLFPLQPSKLTRDPFHQTDNGGDLQIWSIVEISMTLIAASIPVLRPFLRDAIFSAGRYISADASDVRTDPYGRSRSKSQGTTSTNPTPQRNPPRCGGPPGPTTSRRKACGGLAPETWRADTATTEAEATARAT